MSGFHLYAGRQERYALIDKLTQDLEFISKLKGSQGRLEEKMCIFRRVGVCEGLHKFFRKSDPAVLCIVY